MDAIARAAYVSVGRACGFAGLAILTFMVGLSYEPVLSARMGAMLSLALTATLLFKAWRAEAKPFKSTEAWIILTDSERPPAAAAQQVIGQALREAFVWHARATALVTVILAAAAVVLALLEAR